MEIFVTVYFVLICLSILLLCMVEYPIIKDTTKGEDVLRLIISIGLALWSGILLYRG